MVVNIEIDEKIDKEEIIIRCKKLNNEIMEIYYSLLNKAQEYKNLVLKKDDTDYYIKLDEIIFFETDNNCISAHTINDIYTSNYKLYELEEILPKSFIRISKSSILNINHVYSIKRNLTSSSLVSFRNTYKQIYVSRRYYKELKIRINEMRSII